MVDYLQGKVKVDEYVTHEFKFADINKGFDAMHVSYVLFAAVLGICLTALVSGWGLHPCCRRHVVNLRCVVGKGEA